jgi:hypothetical protein
MNPSLRDGSIRQFPRTELVECEVIGFVVFICLLRIGLLEFEAQVTPSAALPSLLAFPVHKLFRRPRRNQESFSRGAFEQQAHFG